MHWIVLVGAYIILWFLALQILLPIGIKAPHESGDAVLGGVDPGAPAQPRLGLKSCHRDTRVGGTLGNLLRSCTDANYRHLS